MTLARFALLSLLLAACGGTTPPTESPADEPPTPVTAKNTPQKPEEPETKAPDPTETPAEAPQPPTPEAPSDAPAASAELSKKPTEILGGPMVAFIVDYQGSTPYETAAKNCETESKGDASARADCMQKARGEFRADVLHFKKEQGRWWLIVYERKGSNLPEVYKTQFDFADEKKDRVTVKLKDTGKQGTRPFFTGEKQIVVALPDDYSIRLDDPKLGRLVYNAKVGLVGK